jgi:hypothetical protein
MMLPTPEGYNTSGLETEEYHLRTYQQGDEKDLILLFNRFYEPFAGFVPRTLKYWTWCILSRPGLSEEGIVVALEAERVVGYAAVENSGNVLEFCYDPSCSGKTIVLKLLAWCLHYTQDQGASAMTFNAPVQDKLIRQVCKELGFTEEPFPSLFLRVIDLPHILSAISKQKNVEKGLKEAILINLRKFPPWCVKQVAILVQDGEVIVSTEKLEHPTIEIEADISTISSCVFGSKRTLYKTALEGRLRIRPLRKILRALKILSVFQLKNPPWFVPGADYG